MRPLLALALLIALAAPAAAQVEAQTSRHFAITPSRAIGRTHDCSDHYPDLSRRLNESGDVLIGYDVGADGVIGNVHVIKSSGSARLDAAALSCVSERWRNSPAMRNGAAIASPGHQAIIRFTLHEGSVLPGLQTPAQAAAPVPPWVTGWTSAWIAMGGAALAAFIFLIIGLLMSRRECPSCGAVNRSPFGATYCSRCGTKFES